MGASVVSLSVKHVVIAALSQEAQRAAARVGQPAAAIQSWDLAQGQVSRALDMGAVVEEDGSVVLAHRVRVVDRSDTREGGAWVRGAKWREEWSDSDSVPAMLSRRPGCAMEALDLIESAREAAQVMVDDKAREALSKALGAPVGESRYWLDSLAKAARMGRLASAETAALDARIAAEDKHEAVEAERKEAEAVAALRVRIEAYLAGSEVKLWITSYHDDERRAQAHYPALLGRARTTRDEREAAKVKADQAALVARQNKLAALVREASTDPLVLGRLDAPEGGQVMLGLLPEDEAVELVRKGKLPIPTGTVDYATRKLAAADARAECEAHDEDGYPDDEDGCEASYASSEPDSLTADEWREATAIRAALKGAGLPEGEMRLHTGTCACASASVDAARRVGVLVRLDLGDGVTLKREYASS